MDNIRLPTGNGLGRLYAVHCHPGVIGVLRGAALAHLARVYTLPILGKVVVHLVERLTRWRPVVRPWLLIRRISCITLNSVNEFLHAVMPRVLATIYSEVALVAASIPFVVHEPVSRQGPVLPYHTSQRSGEGPDTNPSIWDRSDGAQRGGGARRRGVQSVITFYGLRLTLDVMPIRSGCLILFCIHGVDVINPGWKLFLECPGAGGVIAACIGVAGGTIAREVRVVGGGAVVETRSLTLEELHVAVRLMSTFVVWVTVKVQDRRILPLLPDT